MSITADVERALELKRAGRLDEAAVALESVLGRAPSHALALANLADVQVRRQRYAEAAEALDRAESVAGTTRFTARVRGDLAYKQRNHKSAVRAYQDAEALGDHSGWVRAQIARCLVHLGDLAGARAAAARAAEQDAGSSHAWLMLGDIAQREGHIDEAVAHLERAHGLAPGDSFIYARLIEAKLHTLPEGDRLGELDVVLRSRGKGNRHLLALRARLRSEAGDEDGAAATWRQADAGLYARKMEGFALRRAGRLDEAAAVLRSCVLEDPTDLVLFRTYIHLERQRGAVDELKATLERLLPVAGDRRGAVYGELRKLEAG